MTDAEKRAKQKLSKKDLNKKLRLERQLMNRMRSYFGEYADDLFLSMSQLGVVLDPESTRPQLEAILDKHYRGTVDVFAPSALRQVNAQLRAEGMRTIDDSDPMMLAAILLFISSNVTESTDKIMATTKRELAEFAIASDFDATITSDKMKERALPRSNTIAMTETQKAAEGAKFTTYEASGEMISSASLGAALLQTVKTWIDVGDTKVRPAHALADFQQVFIEEPFIVGGELLMYPGDFSLGASPWNVMNCRCNAVYDAALVVL